MNRTTQAAVLEREAREADRVHAADIDRLISAAWIAVGPPEYSGAKVGYIEPKWDNGTYQALIIKIGDMMHDLGVQEWTANNLKVKIIAGVPGSHVLRVECLTQTLILSPCYPTTNDQWVDNWYGCLDDSDYSEQIQHWIETEVAAATGLEAGHCHACHGPAWYTEWYDFHTCPHCQAVAVECDYGCYDMGTHGHCMHHGARAVPVPLLEHFNRDHDRAWDWLDKHGGVEEWRNLYFEWYQDAGDAVAHANGVDRISDSDRDSDSDSHSDSTPAEAGA